MEPEAPFYRKSHRDGYVRHRGLRGALLDDRLRGLMSTTLVLGYSHRTDGAAGIVEPHKSDAEMYRRAVWGLCQLCLSVRWSTPRKRTLNTRINSSCAAWVAAIDLSSGSM